MKRALSFALLTVTILSLASTTYSVNCMWDNSCENPKYDINFCGNGQCEPFESKDTCVQDCGSLLDIIAGKIKSFFATKEASSGPFGGIADSGVAMILAFFVVIIVLVVLGVILIVVYNKMVGSIEREIIPSGE